MRKVSLIIGCGILKEEILFLIKKNGWSVETTFLPSSLHVDFNRLKESLENCLGHHAGETPVVFYGVCHPLMSQILDKAQTIRTPGQNCVDICLGNEIFSHELEQGAFFLFEEWARNWKKIACSIMPGDPEIMRDIFRYAHKYILAIRTPCSGDFMAEAEEVSRMTSLELRWMDAGLEKLEQTLAETIRQAETGNGKDE